MDCRDPMVSTGIEGTRKETRNPGLEPQEAGRKHKEDDKVS